MRTCKEDSEDMMYVCWAPLVRTNTDWIWTSLMSLKILDKSVNDMMRSIELEQRHQYFSQRYRTLEERGDFYKNPEDERLKQKLLNGENLEENFDFSDPAAILGCIINQFQLFYDHYVEDNLLRCPELSFKRWKSNVRLLEDDVKLLKVFRNSFAHGTN